MRVLTVKFDFFGGASRAFLKYLWFIATLNLKMTRSEHDLGMPAVSTAHRTTILELVT